MARYTSLLKYRLHRLSDEPRMADRTFQNRKNGGGEAVPRPSTDVLCLSGIASFGAQILEVPIGVLDVGDAEGRAHAGASQLMTSGKLQRSLH